MADTAETKDAPQATRDGGNSSVLPLNRDIRVLLAQFADNGALLNLRLACKELSWEMEDEFIERFFTYRKHLVSNHSLGALARICSKSRLTRKLRSIEFISAGPEDDTDDRDPWQREHRELIEGGHLSGLFWSMFHNLSRDQRTPAIAVNDCSRSASHGEAYAQRKHNQPVQPRSSEKVILILLSEIYKTDFRLAELHLCQNSVQYHLGIEEFETPAGLWYRAQNCWSRLSTLSLGMCEGLILEDSDSLAEMLAEAVNLTTLSIVKKSYLHKDLDIDNLKYFARVAGHLPLQKLSLIGYEGSLECFIGLLAPLSETLKAVQFEENYVDEPDCWSTFCRHLLENFHLTDLCLSNLCRKCLDPLDGLSVFKCKDVANQTKFDESGEEVVANGLREMCSRTTYFF